MSQPQPNSSMPLTAPTSNARTVIRGLSDRIAPIREAIAGMEDVDPDLRKYIDAEISQLESNAATVHMHDILRPGGGFDLHLTIIPLHLGLPGSDKNPPALPS